MNPFTHTYTDSPPLSLSLSHTHTHTHTHAQTHTHIYHSVRKRRLLGREKMRLYSRFEGRGRVAKDMITP